MAYVTATILANDLQPNGTRIVKVQFTGNAGEPVKYGTTTIDTATTALDLRRWAIAQAAQGDNVQTIGTLPALQVGQTLNVTPITPPAPTAQEIWLEKARRLVRLKALGLTNATAVADVAALQADVDAIYLTAYKVVV